MPAKIKTQLAGALSAFSGLIIGGTIVYHNIEGWSWVESFYFCVTSLTTVGYGTLHPTSEFSMLFTAFYVLFGVAIGITTLSIVGSYYLRLQDFQLMQRLRDQQEGIVQKVKNFRYRGT